MERLQGPDADGPLRDRFGVVNRLDFYTKEELSTIVKNSAKMLEIEIDDQGALEIARRSEERQGLQIVC